MRPFPDHGMCFVCGPHNPHGIGIQWYVCDDGTITSEITLNQYQQGPPGHVHGGASAALLDEAMGLAVWAAGRRVVAVNLNIDFRKPVPLGQPITIKGRMVQQEGRALHSTGEITLADGTVAVTGRGVFVEAPQLLDGVDEPFNYPD